MEPPDRTGSGVWAQVAAALSRSEAENLERFFDTCAKEFCRASQRAILEIADRGMELVYSLYDEYLTQAAARVKALSNPLVSCDAPVLQTIFDLYWFEWLLYVSNTDGKSNQLERLVQRLVDPGNDFIDPINWELYGEVLASRVKTYRERNALLFGPMLMVKAFYQDRRTLGSTVGMGGFMGTVDSSSAYDTNNTLYLGYLGNKTLSRIPLLPISSRSLQHKLSSMRSNGSMRRGSSSDLLTAASSPAASSTLGGVEDSASALKQVMGQVGSNLFSQASSWLNR
jgi:hypothetical protein